MIRLKQGQTVTFLRQLERKMLPLQQGQNESFSKPVIDQLFLPSPLFEHQFQTSTRKPD